MLAIARKKRSKVEKFIERLIRSNDVNNAVAQIASQNLGPRNLEKTIDIILNDTSAFTPSRELVLSQNYPTFFKRETTRVYLFGYLPSKFEVLPPCLFMFRALGIRDVMITLDGKTILRDLTVNRNSRIEEGERSFISPGLSKEKYTISLGYTRFSLYADEANELSDIIDDYTEQYISSLLTLNKEQLSNVSVNDQLQAVLFSIPAYYANHLFKAFSHKEMTVNNYIIEVRENIICIFDNFSSNIYKNVTFVHTEADNQNFSSLKEPDVKFYISLEKGLEDIIAPSRIKSLFVEEIFPKLIFDLYCSEQQTASLYQQKRKPPDYNLWKQNNWPVEAFRYKLMYENNPYLSEPSLHGDLLYCIERLQSFFSIRSGSFFLKSGLSSFYYAFESILSSCTLGEENWDYITSHFPGESAGITKKDVLRLIDLRKKNNDPRLIWYSEIEYSFRCMLEALGSTTSQLDAHAIRNVFANIKPVIDEYHSQSMINEFI